MSKLSLVITRTAAAAAFVAIVLGAAALRAAEEPTTPEPPLPLASPTVRAEVEAVIRQYSAWYKDMYTSVKSPPPMDLFDRNEAAPQYLAEEMPDWLVGWDRLNWYFRDPQRNAVMVGQDMLPSNIRVRSLSPDLALATWNIFADMKFTRGPPMGEKLRAQAILRKTRDGWRFIYYAESARATMAYVREMYEDRARPEFKEEMAAEAAAKAAAAPSSAQARPGAAIPAH